jgi:general nucleoside transport system permease protein
MVSFAGALGGSLLVGAVLIALAGANPLLVFWAIGTGALGDPYHVAETLVRTIPLALVALGAAVALRAGVFTVGAEGQMTIGALVATAAVLAVPNILPPLMLLVGACAGAAGGAAWALLPAVARARAGVNEILSTLLLNYVAAFLLTFVLKGPLRNPAAVATPQSPDLPAAALIPKALEGTRLHWGIAVVVVAALLLAWWVRTPGGFAFDVFGARPDLARRMGATRFQAIVVTMLVAGAAAGLAGWIQVAGVQGRLYTSVAGGIGFNGVVVAVLGGLGAPGILAAALFFGALATGAEGVQAQLGIPSAIASIIQAVLLIAVAVALAARTRYLRMRPPALLAGDEPRPARRLVTSTDPGGAHGA